MYEEKIQGIRAYLKERFPQDKHEDMRDSPREGHMFKIVTKDHVLLATVRRPLLHDKGLDSILSMLEEVKIKDLLLKNHNSITVVDLDGWSISPRN